MKGNGVFVFGSVGSEALRLWCSGWASEVGRVYGSGCVWSHVAVLDFRAEDTGHS